MKCWPRAAMHDRAHGLVGDELVHRARQLVPERRTHGVPPLGVGEPERRDVRVALDLEDFVGAMGTPPVGVAR